MNVFWFVVGMFAGSLLTVIIMAIMTIGRKGIKEDLKKSFKNIRRKKKC